MSRVLPASYQAVEIGNATLVAQASELTQLTSLLQQHGTLYQAAARLPRITELSGRDVAIVAEFAGQPWVVRHYHRGGAVMRILADRYVSIGEPRVLHELQVNEAARARGIPTPQFKAGAWYAHGIFRRSDIATAYIPESYDLATILFAQGVAHNLGIAQAAQLIRLLIARGLLHRDLNLKNVLVAPSGAYVLDLDRCALVDRISAAQANVMRDRFFRSLRKWERKTGINLAEGIKRTLDEAFRG